MKNRAQQQPRLKHSLGQNFILDEGIQAELADLSGVGKADRVLEVGAGSGMLTKQLAARCEEVIAVEIDQELMPWLKAATLSFSNVRIVQGDAMRLPLKELTEGFCPFHVVANLPYHITSRLMTRLLDSRLPVLSIHVMLQRESAEKLCAGPGDEGYGPLPLKAQWYFEPGIRKVYPPSVFTPPPKVDSAFLSMRRRERPPASVSDEKALFRVITGIFAQKRKTLLNNLTASFHLDRETACALIGDLEADMTVRAETLTIADMARLTELMIGKGLL